MRRFVLISSVFSSVAFGLGGVVGSRYEQRKHNQLNNSSYRSRWSIFTSAAAAKLQTITKDRSSEIMTFGLDDIRTRNNYVVSYDRRMRNAKWVFECLTRDEVKYNDAIDRANFQFEADQSLHPFFQSTNEDYLRSGYDRGHMAAAANHRRSPEAMQDTFILSNISPQVGEGFNRGIWNTLEKYVRRLTRVYSKVYVCTGPLYLPQRMANNKYFVTYEVIGPNSVAVPTHFFKVVVGETTRRDYDVRAFVIPNRVLPDDSRLADYLEPVENIERAAGFLLFDQLPKEQLRSINKHLE